MKLNEKHGRICDLSHDLPIKKLNALLSHFVSPTMLTSQVNGHSPCIEIVCTGNYTTFLILKVEP